MPNLDIILIVVYMVIYFMSGISITIKLYSGIEKELKIHDYEQNKGLIFTVKPGTTLRSILKRIGIKKMSQYTYFCGGHHVSVWKRFYDPAEVSCLRMSGGG